MLGNHETLQVALLVLSGNQHKKNYNFLPLFMNNLNDSFLTPNQVTCSSFCNLIRECYLFHANVTRLRKSAVLLDKDRQFKLYNILYMLIGRVLHKPGTNCRETINLYKPV